MCGIVGVASRTPVESRAWLADGCRALQHRGPDDDGEWWSEDGHVGLAFRRLAIIDLSAAGHQPMMDVRGELCIVFNGEIYNFKELRAELLNHGHEFRSQSDTEVILAAYREWGTDCLSRLNGMFALALYDIPRRRLFMARDRAGEKPLFYRLAASTLRFASELKALMADPAFERRVDPVALDCYLAMGYVPGSRCILRGVNKLPAAHALTFDMNDGETRVWRYWHLPEPADRDGRSVDDRELEEELESLLEDAVRRQLVADVPVGLLLSGGLDSSLVTAMATRSSAHVKCYTVRFPGFSKHDETDHARLIARRFSTEHVEIEAAETTTDLLPQLARQFDEPIVDSSMIPTFLVTKEIRRHCTVALGGDGGDELFGGYPHYDRMLWMQARVRMVPAFVRTGITRGAQRWLPIGVKGRNWLQAVGTDLKRGVPHVAAHFDRRAREQLLGESQRRHSGADTVWEDRTPVSTSLLQRATRMDFENYFAEDILVKVDRASMLNSLEIRAPLLDYRIIEFAFGKVPSRLKATADSRKILLKRIAERVLPPEFNKQRKQGFSIPLADWLQGGPWRDYFRDVLLADDSAPFDKQFVGSLLDGQAKGRSNSERLFSLVMFALWRKEYRVSLA